MALTFKDPAEQIDITFDFSTQFTTVTSPTVTVSLHKSLDDIPEMHVTSPVITNSNKVIFRIQGGESGQKYDLRCEVTTNTGEVVVAKDVLTVKTL